MKRPRPSIKTLEAAFPGKGKTLRRLLTSNEAVFKHEAAIRLYEQSHYPPKTKDMRMAALDAELEYFGVEYVPHGRNARSRGFLYSNSGDTYNVTIVRFDDGVYAVTDIGAIIERGRYD